MSLADDLQKQVEKWAKTQSGKKSISKQLKYSGVAQKNAEEIAQKWAKRMQEILEEELSNLKTNEDKAFLTGTTLVGSPTDDTVGGEDVVSVPVYFDEDAVTRYTMTDKEYEPVFMPLKINCPVKMAAKHAVYGTWHGKNIHSSLKWHNGDGAGFIQRAVEQFNKEAKAAGVEVWAEYNDMYNDNV